MSKVNWKGRYVYMQVFREVGERMHSLAHDAEEYAKKLVSDPYNGTPSQPGKPPKMRHEDGLMESIKGEVKLTAKGFQVQIKSDRIYALYLEYGTRKMRPRPFMRPTLRYMKANMFL